MTISLAVVSASDATFFDLLRGLVGSIRDKPEGRSASLCIFDLGMTEAQQRWLWLHGAVLQKPSWRLGHDISPVINGLFARSRIPDCFPGFETYLWLDADAWIQDWQGVLAYRDGAQSAGFSVAAEIDRAYSLPRLMRVHQDIFDQYDRTLTPRLMAKPIVNAGVFAGQAGAPHWELWANEVERAFLAPHSARLDFFLDQAALNVVVNMTELTTAIMPSTVNWTCHWALPVVSDDGITLRHPLFPYVPLQIIHLTAETKQGFHQLRTIGGGTISRSLRYQAPSQLAAGDYVSPALAVTLPDSWFPHIVERDKSANGWAHLRREIPHRRYSDARTPEVGFANRDEMAILYNTALRFQGKNALQMGCSMGWSAVHLALGGVVLDVIDPMLEHQTVSSSVGGSLTAAKIPGPVRLIGGRSPEMIERLAAEGRRWSLFFIDGNHEGTGPRDDAIICDRYALPDALMLFHDLTSPFVAEGVMYLKQRGWNVRIYHTAQIMAAAWRGAVDPVVHQPDPRVEWVIPDHLQSLMEQPARGGEQ